MPNSPRVAIALLVGAVVGATAFGEAFTADYTKARTDRWNGVGSARLTTRFVVKGALRPEC